MISGLFGKIYKRLIKTGKVKNNNLYENVNQQISADLQENLAKIKAALGDSDDVVIRKFTIGLDQGQAFLLYIDGLIDKTFVSDNIIKPLTVLNPLTDTDVSVESGRFWRLLTDSVLTANNVRKAADFNAVLTGILAGDTALFISGNNKALVIEAKGYETRGVTEPETEAVVRGPREGFTEALRTNTTLIRRKIKNPNLRIETLTIGRYSGTDVCIAYVKGIVNEKNVTELKDRLNRIDTDAALGAGVVEAFIEDAPFSLFPTVGNTERPDVAAAKILEGRIAIITEGTPIVLTVPFLFVEVFQSPEDYLTRPYYMTVIRWVRYLAYFTSVYMPAIYIALVTFHHEMVPTPLLVSIAAARERVPFPALVEALGMGLTFEFLREAGIRMPRPVGQAVSIVGALVIGEAAVSAGLVGAPMVIVTALTAITSFITPMITDVITMQRIIITVLSGVAGFYGIMLGTLVFMIHTVSLRSFGVPYLSPLAPLTVADLKDVVLRAPLWAMKTRPRLIGFTNRRRQGPGQKPGPSRAGDKPK